MYIIGHRRVDTQTRAYTHVCIFPAVWIELGPHLVAHEPAMLVDW